MNVWLHPAENCPGFGRPACPAAGYWTQSCSGSCGAPGSPSEVTGLLEVQKPCLASKSCLPSLRRSRLCLNAYFQLCVSAPSPREPSVPRDAHRAAVLSPAPRGECPSAQTRESQGGETEQLARDRRAVPFSLRLVPDVKSHGHMFSVTLMETDTETVKTEFLCCF